MWGFIRNCISRLYHNPSFLIALVTAIVLVFQTCNISKQTGLYEENLQAEQKPILFQGVGEYQEIILDGHQLIVSEHCINLGKLPAYNVTFRYAIRVNSEYPSDFFESEMLTDSLYHNILFPGVPRIDTISITIDTNADSLSKRSIAYLMYQRNMKEYIHYWIEYEDIAGRFYVLQQTFGLHGREDSTFYWSQEFAKELEYDSREDAI
jgi:hypothetical protein